MFEFGIRSDSPKRQYAGNINGGWAVVTHLLCSECTLFWKLVKIYIHALT